jgi:hypothetical protein
MAQVEEGVGGIFEAAIEITAAGRAEYRAGIERRLGVAQGGVKALRFLARTSRSITEAKNLSPPKSLFIIVAVADQAPIHWRIGGEHADALGGG